MEINVQDIIPQRPPFQMIDQLVDLEAGKRRSLKRKLPSMNGFLIMATSSACLSHS